MMMVIKFAFGSMEDGKIGEEGRKGCPDMGMLGIFRGICS